MSATSKLVERLTQPKADTSQKSCFQTRAKVFSQADDEKIEGFVWPRESCWVISRELLLFQRLSLTDVPAKFRERVIDQKVQPLSPFKDTGTYSHIEGDVALVWMWDEANRANELAAMTEEQPSNHLEMLPVLPETVFQSDVETGCVIRPCYSGFDLQKWHDGLPDESYWSESDSELSKIDFSRLVGANESVQFLNVANDPHDVPWVKRSETIVSLVQEKTLTLTGILILGFCLLFYMGQWVGWHYEIISLNSQIESKKQNVDGVLGLREETIRLRESNQQLKSWFDRPSQLQIAAGFDAALVSVPFEILEWHYQQQELRVTMSAPGIDNRQIVESLSKNDLFEGVRIEPAVRENIVVVMRIKI